MNQSGELVIIGSGIAGISAALSARKEYPQASISVYTEESFRPYNKIALGAYIPGKKTQGALRLFADTWLKQHRIAYRVRERVQKIHPDKKLITFESGIARSYDSLILATGVSNFIPPIAGVQSEGVYPLWTLKDAVAIKNRIIGAQSIVVIGAGVLGVELADELSILGKSITLVERMPYIIPHLLPPTIANEYKQRLENKGITIHTQEEVTQIRPMQNKKQVVLQSGMECDADMIIIVTGVVPNIQLARDAELVVNRGILVDHQLRTSDPTILACGNVIEMDGNVSLLWNPAKSQGMTAGINAFAPKQTWKPLPSIIHLKTPDNPLFIGGEDHTAAPGCVEIEDRGERGNDYRKFIFNNKNQFLSVIMLGNTYGHYEVELAMKQQLSLPAEVIQGTQIQSILEYVRAHYAHHQTTPRSWVCHMCGYVHEGEYPPEICPVCWVGKDQFTKA
jgi:NADH oxidase (H2O-forming)